MIITPRGERSLALWPLMGVARYSPPKSLPMPVKTNEDRKTGSYCNEGRLCARARTANRSSGASCCRNQPRPNVPDNPIILVAAKAKVSLGSKLPAGSCSTDHFASLTELATVTSTGPHKKGGSQVASALFPVFFLPHIPCSRMPRHQRY